MSKSKSPISKDAARRIQSATAKKNGGAVPKKSFAAKAASIAAKNANKGTVK